MKKKVFFVLSSLNAGGAERVFWLLSQNLNKSLYDITIVLLDSRTPFFSTDLPGITVVDLKTIRVSRSFFQLFRLLKREKPYAVFTTGGQINTLAAIVSLFAKIPLLIARPTNEAGAAKFVGKKAKILSLLKNFSYSRFNKIICQSEEIRDAVLKKNNRLSEKIIIIPNPVLPTSISKQNTLTTVQKRIIVAARLEKQKGHERLLNVFKSLPQNYVLTIAGDGSMRNEIIEKTKVLGIEERVQVIGLVQNIREVIAQHDLLVLSSYVEGFPNVAAEALSVGVPVVSFKVGGISQLVKNDLNGFVVKQNDLEEFKKSILKACNKSWSIEAIKNDVVNRFSIEKVVDNYQKLLA